MDNSLATGPKASLCVLPPCPSFPPLFPGHLGWSWLLQTQGKELVPRVVGAPGIRWPVGASGPNWILARPSSKCSALSSCKSVTPGRGKVGTEPEYPQTVK